MQTFGYTITDEVGIHARPAGLLVKEAGKFKSTILVKANGKSADATRLMALMALGIKCGQQIEVSIEGEDEEDAFAGMKNFFERNL